jgi:hypothetical protein
MQSNSICLEGGTIYHEHLLLGKCVGVPPFIFVTYNIRYNKFQ